MLMSIQVLQYLHVVLTKINVDPGSMKNGALVLLPDEFIIKLNVTTFEVLV